jgi:polyketide cyclase/dehydrase/lipid transport protein
MASIYKEFIVRASLQHVWDAIKDVGSVHSRLAQGFVTNTVLEGDTRTVTFSNGYVAKEQVISVSDELHRFVYRSVGGRASHHNAYFQLFPASEGCTKIVWVTDLLPEEMRDPIEQMVKAGSQSIQKTLEKSFLSK